MESDENQNLGFDELIDSANKAVAQVHFRFYCSHDETEQQLLDSVSRSWSEITELYPNIPVHGDFNNIMSYSLFPVNADTTSHVEDWEGVPIEVYQTGMLISGGSPINENSVVLPEGIVRRLYQEQFVVRLSFYIVGEPESARLIEELLHNVIQSADLPGSILLSMEWQSLLPHFPFNLDKVIPDTQTSYSYQPLLGLSRRSPESFFAENAEAILFEEDATTTPIDFLGLDKGRWGVFSSLKMVSENEESIELHTRLVFQYNNCDAQETHSRNASIFGVVTANRVVPLWTATFENNGWVFARHIQIPSFSTPEDVFFAARSYPASSVFGDRYGSFYNLLLLGSKMPMISQLITSGVYIERDVADSGEIYFVLVLPQSDYSDSSDSSDSSEHDDIVIHLGGELAAEQLFLRLHELSKDNDELVLELDDIIDIVEDINEVSGEMPSPYFHSKSIN
jgi:hypothetical protein